MKYRFLVAMVAADKVETQILEAQADDLELVSAAPMYVPVNNGPLMLAGRSQQGMALMFACTFRIDDRLPLSKPEQLRNDSLKPKLKIHEG